jgi:hypothetical protein
LIMCKLPLLQLNMHIHYQHGYHFKIAASIIIIKKIDKKNA